MREINAARVEDAAAARAKAPWRVDAHRQQVCGRQGLRLSEAPDALRR
jgi:hypothetical protein